MNIGLERKNLDKPPEIRKAAVRAGYYADDSLKRLSTTLDKILTQYIISF